MVFSQVEDYLVFLEPIPPEVPFNVRQFSQARRISENLARKIIYTLCKLGVIEKVGKDGRRKLYQRKYCG
jgi:ribosomal protein S25